MDTGNVETAEYDQGSLIRSCLPPISTRSYAPGKAWHYTDHTGGHGIISSQALRASSTLFLNDAQELRQGHRLLILAWQQVQQEMAEPAKRFRLPPPPVDGRKVAYLQELIPASVPNDPEDDTLLIAASYSVFICSASMVEDDLSQWRSYTGATGGLSLGIDAQAPLVVRGARATQCLGWHSVLYYNPFFDSWDDQRSRSEAAQAITFALRRLLHEVPFDSNWANLARATLAVVIALVKDIGFSSEHERRAIVLLPAGSSGVRFRPGAHGIIPYVELEAETGLLPITGVRCGPSAEYRQVTLAAVRMFLMSMGYPSPITPVRNGAIPPERSVDLEGSRIPYRA